jgi:glycosyltransferase involved in cell wall biosynthesis
MRKLNILITAPSLDPNYNISGISSIVQMIIKDNDKHFYHHYLLGKPDKKISGLWRIFLLIKRIVLFPLSLKKNNIDIVHQNFPFDSKGILREFTINFWCKLFHVPVVLHIHGGIFLMNKTSNKLYFFLSRKIFKNSKAVIVLSEIEKEALLLNYQYPDALILENCIDISPFMEIKKDKHPAPVFLFMGRIHESKGLNDILGAFRLLKDDNTDFRFILCGDGPLKETIISEFETILGENFSYLGIVSGQRKSDVIKSADYFLLPSWFEGLPLSLMETMAAGLVPVVTNVGSICFLVEDGKSGIIVEMKNPDDLYRKIKKSLSDSDLYKLLSVNAKKSIAERCDLKDYISRLNGIYENVVRY